MNIDDILDVGNEIMDAVTDAVVKNDYSDLSSKIKQSSSPLIDDFLKVNPKPNQASGASDAYKNKPQNKTQYRATLQMPGKTPFLSKKISRNAGLGGIVSGIIGMCIFVPITFSNILGGLILGYTPIFASAAVFAGLSAGMGFLALRGKQHINLARLYNDYGKVIGYRKYIKFEDLARLSNRRVDLVKDDIKKMISKNMLPQAYIDEDETTLMLTPEVYQQYQTARKNYQALLEENKRRTAAIESAAISAETKALLLEGENYLRMVKRNNDLINNEAMSQKLYSLENIIEKIFNQVKKNPDSASNLRKFMNYYLPTTEKLLNAYIDLGNHSNDSGSNIKKTKAEIESAIDTINEAFNNLFDSMFEETAWEISSDISVMKTMLAQDGLTDYSANIKKEI